MNTNDILRRFIMENLIPKGQEVHLSDSDSLVDSGIIDSLGILNILTFLEERFSIEILGDDLVPENFDSIESISALIDKKCRVEAEV